MNISASYQRDSLKLEIATLQLVQIENFQINYHSKQHKKDKDENKLLYISFPVLSFILLIAQHSRLPLPVLYTLII